MSDERFKRHRIVSLASRHHNGDRQLTRCIHHKKRLVPIERSLVFAPSCAFHVAVLGFIARICPSRDMRPVDTTNIGAP